MAREGGVVTMVTNPYKCSVSRGACTRDIHSIAPRSSVGGWMDTLSTEQTHVGVAMILAHWKGRNTQRYMVSTS